MLNGAGAKAPDALEKLLKTLKDKEVEVEKIELTWANISSILHGAGDKAPDALEKLLKILKDKEAEPEKTELTWDNISSMLGGAGAKAPELLVKTLNKLNEIHSILAKEYPTISSKELLKILCCMCTQSGAKVIDNLNKAIEMVRTPEFKAFIQKNDSKQALQLLKSFDLKDADLLKAFCQIKDFNSCNIDKYPVPEFLQKRIDQMIQCGAETPKQLLQFNKRHPQDNFTMKVVNQDWQKIFAGQEDEVMDFADRATTSPKAQEMTEGQGICMNPNDQASDLEFFNMSIIDFGANMREEKDGNVERHDAELFLEMALEERLHNDPSVAYFSNVPLLQALNEVNRDDDAWQGPANHADEDGVIFAADAEGASILGHKHNFDFESSIL